MPDELTAANAVASTAATSSYFVGMVTTLVWRSSQLVAGLGAVLATILYFKQESMLYFPVIGGIPLRPQHNPRRYRSPAEHQLHFEDVQIPCKDGVNIHAWLILRTPERNPLPTLVYFHGNAGNIGLRLPNAVQMMQYLNVNILMVEYRGYGNSDSVSPSEAGLKLDGQGALKFVLDHPKIDNSKIILFGRSLGGAVAFDVARYAQSNNIPIAGVIVENTFTSIAAMVDHLMPVIAVFKGLILKMRWDSLSIVPDLTCPVLYLAGAKDQLVPHKHMLALHGATKRSKLNRIHVVPNGTHNETWMQGGQDYWAAMRSFLQGSVDAATAGAAAALPPASVSVSVSSSSTASTSETNESGSSSAGSIPIMPGQLFGMVKEAVTGENSRPGKKEL
jgi:abhydrolase domain-containing protein 13